MLRRIKDLSVDAIVYGASSASGQVIGFLLLPLYTSYLTPEDYGVLAMLAILTAVYTPLSVLGLRAGVFRFSSHAKSERAQRRVISTAYVGILMSSSIGLVVLLALSPLLSPLLIDSAPLYLTNLTLISAWLISINQVPFAILRLQRKVKTVALISMVHLVVSIGVTIPLVVSFQWGVLGCVCGMLAGAVSQMLLCLAVTSRFSIFAFRYRQFRILLNYGLPFVPHYLQTAGLTYLGQYMIKTFISLEDAGLYNVALKFVLPFQLVVMSFQQAWKPIKFQIREEEPRPAETFRQIFSVYCTVMGVVFLATALLGPVLLRLMVDDRFYVAGRVIPFIALIPFARGLYFMLATGIGLSSSPRKLPLISLLGLVVLVASSPLMIWLQAPGAAIATALGWLAMGLAALVYAQRFYTIKYDLSLTAFVIVLPIVSGLLLSVCQVPLLYSMSIGAVSASFSILAMVKRTTGLGIRKLVAMRARLQS